MQILLELNSICYFVDKIIISNKSSNKSINNSSIMSIGRQSLRNITLNDDEYTVSEKRNQSSINMLSSFKQSIKSTTTTTTPISSMRICNL